MDLLRAAAERGDIPGDLDFDGVVTMLMIIADGVWWRRALDPDFDAGGDGADLHGHHAPHAARPSEKPARDERQKKESSR